MKIKILILIFISTIILIQFLGNISKGISKWDVPLNKRLKRYKIVNELKFKHEKIILKYDNNIYSINDLKELKIIGNNFKYKVYDDDQMKNRNDIYDNIKIFRSEKNKIQVILLNDNIEKIIIEKDNEFEYIERDFELDEYILYNKMDLIEEYQLPNDFCGGVIHDDIQEFHKHVPNDDMMIESNEILDISVVSDAQFYSEMGSDDSVVAAKVVSLIAEVSSHYASSFSGMIVRLQDHVSFKTVTSEPWADTDDGMILLNAIGDYRMSSLPNNDNIYLLTGRNIHYKGSSGVVGICWLSNACASSKYAACLGERYGSYTGVVMSHEIGHNVGSYHDGSGSGNPPNTCSGGYIMYPTKCIFCNYFFIMFHCSNAKLYGS